MQTELKIVAWDTCVIIDAIQKTEGKYQLIEPFLKKAEEGNLLIVVSEVCVAEIQFLNKERELKTPTIKQLEKVLNWLNNDYIIRKNVDPGVSELASRYGLIHNITPLDSIVVANAVFHKVPVLHTFDGTMKKNKKSPLLDLDGKIGDPALKICTPNYDEGLLWESSIKENGNILNLKIEKNNESN